MDKMKMYGIAVACLALFGAGYVLGSKLSGKEKVSTEKEVKNEQTEEHKKKQTVITKQESAGGITKTITVITEDVSKVDTKSETDVKRTKEIDNTAKDLWRVNVMVGADSITNPKPIYGGMVTKKIIGPISGGFFGMTNGTMGLTFGMEF